VNNYPDEPLLAVLPGVALDELWQVVGTAERTLLAVSAIVVAVGLMGLVAVVLASLNERRRELAILRSVGARPADIVVLLAAEAFLVSTLGAMAGVVLLNVATFMLAPLAQEQFGIAVHFRIVSAAELGWLAVVIATAMAASLVPGYRAYRLTLADGLSPRV
jgi:putative ABC transport system permease protein